MENSKKNFDELLEQMKNDKTGKIFHEFLMEKKSQNKLSVSDLRQIQEAHRVALIGKNQKENLFSFIDDEEYPNISIKDFLQDMLRPLLDEKYSVEAANAIIDELISYMTISEYGKQEKELPEIADLLKIQCAQIGDDRYIKIKNGNRSDIYSINEKMEERTEIQPGRMIRHTYMGGEYGPDTVKSYTENVAKLKRLGIPGIELGFKDIAILMDLLQKHNDELLKLGYGTEDISALKATILDGGRGPLSYFKSDELNSFIAEGAENAKTKREEIFKKAKSIYPGLNTTTNGIKILKNNTVLIPIDNGYELFSQNEKGDLEFARWEDLIVFTEKEKRR